MQMEEKNLACNLSATKLDSERCLCNYIDERLTEEAENNSPGCWPCVLLINPRSRRWISILSCQRGNLHHEPIDTMEGAHAFFVPVMMITELGREGGTRKG